MICNFPAVLSFNRLFLKLNRFVSMTGRAGGRAEAGPHFEGPLETRIALHLKGFRILGFKG